MSIGTRSELDRREFERMMDDGVEDAIRLVRDRLKAALDDPGTPANTLPAIGRQYIELCERLQGMDGQADLFGQTDDMGVTEVCERLQGMDGQADLFGQTDDMGVTEDVGASIV